MLGQGHAEPESPRPKSPKRDYTLQESLENLHQLLSSTNSKPTLTSNYRGISTHKPDRKRAYKQHTFWVRKIYIDFCTGLYLTLSALGEFER